MASRQFHIYFNFFRFKIVFLCCCWIAAHNSKMHFSALLPANVNAKHKCIFSGATDDILQCVIYTYLVYIHVCVFIYNIYLCVRMFTLHMHINLIELFGFIIILRQHYRTTTTHTRTLSYTVVVVVRSSAHTQRAIKLHLQS